MASIDFGNVVRSLIFGLSVSTTSCLIRMRFPNTSFTTPSNEHALFQPPRWLFGIVWPLLYILVGVTWVLIEQSLQIDLMFVMITLLSCIWLPVHLVAKQYVISTIILVFCAGISVAILALTTSAFKWLLSPFVIWILFACYLNLHRATIKH